MLFIGFSLISSAAFAGSWRDKIDAQLYEKAVQGGRQECLVVMTGKADFSGIRLPDKKADKGAFVFNRLKAFAEDRQRPIQEFLRGRQIAFTSFFIVNAIYLKADLGLLEEIAQRADVQRIDPNPWVEQDMPREIPANARDVEWGVAKILADSVWSMGITGQGVIIGGQDTGVEWDHSLIKSRYRGWVNETPDHNYNWHDAIHALSPINNDPDTSATNNPCGLNSKVPCDDNNHGTYTIGIVLGDDGAGNQTGVAPGATWIACRNMDRGSGSPATYIEGFQWFLAPTDVDGNNPNPAMAPHVINNSWSCPESEGCNPGNWDLMEEAVENLRTAGVVVIVSAGNEGPNCHTIDAAPAIFSGAFAVGATRSNDTIANFSSRGLVAADGSFRPKPDVSAPGVGIRSARRGNKFMTANGTSAAGPMVVGVVALMLEANPLLEGKVETIESILRAAVDPAYADQTCDEISGETFPNPMVGYGRINALTAVEMALDVNISDTSENVLPDIKISPNPFREEVKFEIPTAGEVALSVFDVSGRRLTGTTSKAETFTVNLGRLPSGVYFYEIRQQGRTWTGKLVKL